MPENNNEGAQIFTISVPVGRYTELIKKEALFETIRKAHLETKGYECDNVLDLVFGKKKGDGENAK